MTPSDLRAARKRLGLTQKGLATALRMGTHGWQSISKWERDGGTIPGPVQVAVLLMLGSAEFAVIGENALKALRDSGSDPEGEKPQALSAKHRRA